MAGAVEWEKECGRMEGEGGNVEEEGGRERRGNHIRGLVAVINGG